MKNWMRGLKLGLGLLLLGLIGCASRNEVTGYAGAFPEQYGYEGPYYYGQIWGPTFDNSTPPR
jgi:hypothetical protein